jgi:hypothetical protein
MKRKPDTRTTKKEEDLSFEIFTEDYLINENLIRKIQT